VRGKQIAETNKKKETSQRTEKRKAKTEQETRKKVASILLSLEQPAKASSFLLLKKIKDSLDLGFRVKGRRKEREKKPKNLSLNVQE